METDTDPSLTDPNPIASKPATTRRLGQTLRTGTRPFRHARGFLKRPAGAIFGENYLYQALISTSENEHSYEVEMLGVGADMQVRICPNPNCGAIFPPRSEVPEIYCTDCGTVLEKGGKDLLLIETSVPAPDNIVRVASKGLSHGSVRAPLVAFVERLGDEPRHCVILPHVQMFREGRSDTLDHRRSLNWGQTLARGLDYLHDNGVHFDGKLNPGCVGLIGDRAVWANFDCCDHHPEGYVVDRAPDTLALAHLVYYWLTGRDNYEIDSKLSPATQQVFEQIFTGLAPRNGQEFARLLEKAVGDGDVLLAVDLHSGRRSDVGMVRSLNEDSLLALDLDRTQQSVTRSIGVYVVADGMGGHAGGEVASGQIVDTFAGRAFGELLPSLLIRPDTDLSTWLKSTVEIANREVFDLRKKAGTDMGSTLVAAALVGNKASITHIGDSRAYLVNSAEIKRLTTDHSLVERMIANHQITREEARHHPQRNVIYRTIGDKSTIDVEVSLHTLAVGDYLLLCSDGLSGMVPDEAMHKIVMSSGSTQAACEELIRAANAAGGEDNVSVILVKVVAP